VAPDRLDGVSDKLDETRKSWNVATRAHNAHKRDQAAFFKSGGSTLFPEELELLRLDGEIAGFQLLHLQCNAGQDSLSLAAETRVRVTGVDLSDEAIAFAKALAKESGIPASFQQGEAITWLESTSLRFDIVFASYGALPWIEDLRRYMRGVARVLVPGGRAVFLEFHPLVWSFSEDWRADRDPYFGQGCAFIEPVRDYVGQSGGYADVNEPYVNTHQAHGYQHTVADIVQAMVDAPLTMTTMREWPYSNGCKMHEGMVDIGANRFGPPPPVSLPLMLGIVARAR